MSSTVATPAVTSLPSRVGQKRKASEAPEGSSSEAKRPKKNGEGGRNEASGRNEPGENMPPNYGAEATSNGKDKKKRKKKKKKMSVVQQNAARDGVPQDSATGVPGHARAKSLSLSSSPVATRHNATPGPSKVSRSPSMSPERLRGTSPSAMKPEDAEGPLVRSR